MSFSPRSDFIAFTSKTKQLFREGDKMRFAKRLIVLVRIFFKNNYFTKTGKNSLDALNDCCNKKNSRLAISLRSLVYFSYFHFALWRSTRILQGKAL